MSLILCPECNKEISDRAESCPNCGLPAKHFNISAKKDTITTANTSLDLSILRNNLISFEHSYQTFFWS